MVNLTEIMEKQLRDGENILGVVQNLLFDNFGKTCFVETEQDIFVVDKVAPRWDYVAASAKVFENQQLTKTADRMQFLRKMQVGQKIVDQNGVELGEVADVEFNAKLVIKQLLVSSGQYLKRGDIVAVGDVIVAKAKSAKRAVLDELKKERVLNKLLAPSINSGNTTPQQKATPPQQTNATPQQVTTASAADKESTPATETPNTTRATQVRAVTTNRTIRRKYGDFSFLIGKSVDKTIVNFQGEVMIKQNETINVDVLRQAKISGKLLELYLHIK